MTRTNTISGRKNKADKPHKSKWADSFMPVDYRFSLFA
jgi:hypothetical protein